MEVPTHSSTVPTMLITGATGTIGTELTKLLSDRNIPFRAMVRSTAGAESMAGLNGADIVVGDFNDQATVARALAGVERAFLLTNSTEQAEAQQLMFVDAARRAGIKQIVKLSQWAADLHSPVRFLRYHAAVEQRIKESGIAYTFLRPNLFMQGLLGFRDSIAAQAAFFAPIGDAMISMVDVRDIALVAAAALTEQGHQNKIYDLTGPEALTHQDMAQKLSAALGRSIHFAEVSPESMRDALATIGFPAWQADGLIEDYAHYARGEASELATGVQISTGRPPRSFDTFAHDYASAFS